MNVNEKLQDTILFHFTFPPREKIFNFLNGRWYKLVNSEVEGRITEHVARVASQQLADKQTLAIEYTNLKQNRTVSIPYNPTEEPWVSIGKASVAQNEADEKENQQLHQGIEEQMAAITAVNGLLAIFIAAERKLIAPSIDP